METSVVSEGAARPFDKIPVIQLPEDYPDVLPSFLARMAMQHGPIFRRQIPAELQSLYGPWFV